MVAIGTWSSRVLFLSEDPYVRGEQQRLDSELSEFDRLLEKQQHSLETAKRNNDSDRRYLQSARDSLEGDRRLMRIMHIVFDGISARSDSVQARHDSAFLSSVPPRGSGVWNRSKSAARFTNRIELDSSEVVSIGVSLRGDLAARITPLLAVLAAEKRKWQAISSWAAAREPAGANWRRVLDSERSFRIAFHGAAMVLTNYMPGTGVADFQPHIDMNWDSTLPQRLASLREGQARLEQVAAVRQVLAALGLFMSAFLLFYTVRYAVTGQLPKWWQSLRWFLHSKRLRVPRP